ncbi:unnamed protein product [Angiostrongylus costaricensis]|uniref:Uncharacterized protein n=1 Tax=Angiostrongylus costaricensis TaxID=334426 RepID=A0A0R3PJ11_ANGCS|nr:unnamed protein product [Angiostrongylus costaricensis]
MGTKFQFVTGYTATPRKPSVLSHRVDPPSRPSGGAPVPMGAARLTYGTTRWADAGAGGSESARIPLVAKLRSNTDLCGVSATIGTMG